MPSLVKFEREDGKRVANDVVLIKCGQVDLFVVMQYNNFQLASTW